MSRAETLFASPGNPNRVQQAWLWKDSTFLPSVNWSAIEKDRDTTLNASSWETDDTSVIAISDPTVEDGITTVEVEASNCGCAELKNTATFADGSVSVAKWLINVRD